MSVFVQAGGAALTTMLLSGSTAGWEDAALTVRLRASLSASDSVKASGPVV